MEIVRSGKRLTFKWSKKTIMRVNYLKFGMTFPFQPDIIPDARVIGGNPRIVIKDFPVKRKTRIR